jgi:hypothetical protein
MKNFATYLSTLPKSPLTEAAKSLYESTHTLRAKQVYDYQSKLDHAIDKWLHSIYFDHKRVVPAEVCLDIDKDLKLLMEFHEPTYSGGAWYDEDTNTVCISMGPLIRAVANDDEDIFCFGRDDALNLADKIDQNINSPLSLSLEEFTSLDDSYDSDLFGKCMRHELTHHVQNLDDNPNKFDFVGQLKKLNIDDAVDDVYKYHDIYPWEIDAGVHEMIVDIIKQIENTTPTKMAKQVFDILMSECRQHNINNTELIKQCWDTAVSLTRAVYLARRDGHLDPHEILDNINKYAV